MPGMVLNKFRRFCNEIADSVKTGTLQAFQLNGQALAYAVYKVFDIFENLFNLN